MLSQQVQQPLQNCSDALEVIAEVFGVTPHDITDIAVLKKGMTNRSFLFTCKGKRYIMRVPGEGTDQLINRAQEACVYRAIDRHALSDDVIFIDEKNGYKITAFWPDARPCDASCSKDVRACMQALRRFHSLGLRVDHRFDIFEQIEYYERLWDGAASVYPDHRQTTEQIRSLKPFIQSCAADEVLTHIDAVCDNFLFIDGGKQIRLIDWEYAGMQDPHVDIAMFCIYAMYNKRQIDRTIDMYFPEGCTETVRTKIYAYIAACGLLWSNWCEYKRLLGVEFGEYAAKQYRFAKQYFQYVSKRLQNNDKG